MHLTFLILFLLGMVAGASVALPYGPAGFIIIRRFYLFGFKSGMLSTLGMVLSDAFYAVIVGFGLRSVSHFLVSVSTFAEIIVGVILIGIGIHSMRQKLELLVDEEKNHPARDVISTLVVNIVNPTLLFWFALAISIAVRIVHHPFGRAGTSFFIVGILAGGFALWGLIGGGIRYLRRRNRDELVQKINYITGAILGGLGTIILILAFIHLGVKYFK